MMKKKNKIGENRKGMAKTMLCAGCQSTQQDCVLDRALKTTCFKCSGSKIIVVNKLTP